MNAEELLEKWVNQNSHHDNIAGLMTVLEQVANEAQGLGMEIEWHRAVYGRASALCTTLHATKNGHPINQPSKTILFVTHADTVFPEKSSFQSIHWNEDRSVAIGPGVIDDKGGIIVALLALEKLAALPDRNFEVKFICMPSEEIGSPGYSKWLENISKTASMVLGFEPSLPDGSIIHSRRGNRWYELIMRGPGGHAGRDAGKVPNAASALAALAIEIEKLGSPNAGTSATLGSIHSNTNGFNVIPSETIVKIDVRYDTNELRDQLHSKIIDLIERHPLTDQIAWKLIEDCPAMGFNPESTPWGEKFIQAIERLESKTISIVAASGSSDSNYLYRPGIPMIDGLGPVGSGLHTENETLVVSSLNTRAEAVFGVIREI